MTIPRPRFHLVALLILLPFLAACAPSGDEAKLETPEMVTAAEAGDLARVEELIEDGEDVNAGDLCDWTPLMKAALNGRTDIVRRLLAAGADVQRADQGGYTPLHLAASNNHPETVAALLDAGAEIDPVETTQGFTPLIWAAQRGHAATVRLFLERGADRTRRDMGGKDAAQRAAEGGWVEIAGLLGAVPVQPAGR